MRFALVDRAMHFHCYRQYFILCQSDSRPHNRKGSGSTGDWANGRLLYCDLPCRPM